MSETEHVQAQKPQSDIARKASQQAIRVVRVQHSPVGPDKTGEMGKLGRTSSPELRTS